DHLADLLYLAPWLALPAPPAGMWPRDSDGQLEPLSRLRQTLEYFDSAATLYDVANSQSLVLPLVEAALPTASTETTDWLKQLGTSLAAASEHAGARI